jgi:hypothetical protein
VYPRTKSLEQVQAEWDNQLRGDTADNNIVRIGAGENPLYALACVARRLGEQTMFNASIINLKSGAQETGTSVNYKTINDGMEVMQTLARDLSFGNATEWRVDSAERFMSVVEIINERKEGNCTIILTGNFTISLTAWFRENGSKTVTITGDSQMRTINNGQIMIEKGIHLVLGNNLTLNGNGKDTVVRVSYGSLTLQEGAFLQNGRQGVSVIEGSFTMNGGTISGNTGGGGVEIGNRSTFTMNGGTIRGNTGRYGGGVDIGVYCTFTMNDGTINGNTADSGGGVSNLSGTFRMTGGTISGNTAKENGGGVNNGSTFKIFVKTGGTIDATNSATNGKVAYADGKKRDRAAGPNDNLDSSKKGRAGGWE